ncbi:spore coat protein [Cytobacillus suaedae]|nr:spore coat protein [Cytobacillus suaedae]
MKLEKGKDFNCICEVVLNIRNLQDAKESECTSSCLRDLLEPVQTVGNIIPFLLYTNKEGLFNAYGNIGELLPGDFFKTPFFRVEDVREGCCATLSLLRPIFGAKSSSDNVEDVCSVSRLVNTDICIEVDLTCFCAIQCLDPRLVIHNLDSDICDENEWLGK